MTRSTILTFLMFCSVVSFGQTISVTFTGTGAANQIDSISATNLVTNESITLPGNETLVLGANTGITAISELTNRGMVFPNPFMGQATFTTIVQNPQMAYLKVQNLTGQVIAQTKAFIQPGNNDFVLSVNTAGIYMVSLTTDKGIVSYKIICSESTTPDNKIQYLGSVPDNHNNHSNHHILPQPGLKTSQTSYTLGYVVGDIILYRCMSGIYTTIVTDSPASSKNYEVKFAACTDPDGKNYSIVKIGSQTWTAENLAFLPFVHPPLNESLNTPDYYVYDYEGNIVSDAMATDNYATYGVLYDWEAAMNGASINPENPVAVQGICPNGWHLPSDEEWTALTDYIGESTTAKMRETGSVHWGSANEGTTNATGFTALPGGGRNITGIFQSLGEFTYFWTSSASGASLVWTRKLDNTDDVIRKYFYTNAGFYVRCLLGPGTPGLANLTTTQITGITDTTAFTGGVITSNWGAEITARGVCWNTIENPTVNNNKTTDGSGTGTFTSNLRGLRPGTIYYVRAYAVNSVGVAYGEQKKYKTTGVGGDGTFDYDGRMYTYKTIGTQTWMTENLAWLPMVSPSSVGSNTDAHCYVYGYQGTSVDSAKTSPNYAAYGVLYNWRAANFACPGGWHLPNDAEWTTLTTFLGGESVAGGKMKKTGTTYWKTPNTGATNESGFSAFAGGYRSANDAIFDGLGQYGIFWSSSTPSSSIAWYWYLSYNSAILTTRYSSYRGTGVSVRCIRD